MLLFTSFLIDAGAKSDCSAHSAEVEPRSLACGVCAIASIRGGNLPRVVFVVSVRLGVVATWPASVFGLGPTFEL